jgi:hypothetical protein
MNTNIGNAISTHAPDFLTKVQQLAREVCNVASTLNVPQASVPTKIEAMVDILVAAVQQLTTGRLCKS